MGFEKLYAGLSNSPLAAIAALEALALAAVFIALLRTWAGRYRDLKEYAKDAKRMVAVLDRLSPPRRTHSAQSIPVAPGVAAGEAGSHGGKE